MSSSDPAEPSSPACLAHEADPAYMGYANPAEITAFLREIAAATPETPADRRALIHRIRQMLPKVRDDALYRDIEAVARRLEAQNMPPD